MNRRYNVPVSAHPVSTRTFNIWTNGFLGSARPNFRSSYTFCSVEASRAMLYGRSMLNDRWNHLSLQNRIAWSMILSIHWSVCWQIRLPHSAPWLKQCESIATEHYEKLKVKFRKFSRKLATNDRIVTEEVDWRLTVLFQPQTRNGPMVKTSQKDRISSSVTWIYRQENWCRTVRCTESHFRTRSPRSGYWGHLGSQHTEFTELRTHMNENLSIC